MTQFVSQFFRFVVKLVMAAIGLVFVVSLFIAASVVLVFLLLKSLVTGKKTTPEKVFSRFQKFSPEGLWPRTSTRHGAAGAAKDVVDVEVREIKHQVNNRLP